ncbi:hypothetical protein [Methylobacterium indicum]|uniref:hypothetical protein n=1 Tax=Methylobacterium indicum TaxID=1775910 RepID=UPI001041D4C2|nr:hypothetical protein [Methylobacterium indicum]
MAPRPGALAQDLAQRIEGLRQPERAARPPGLPTQRVAGKRDRRRLAGPGRVSQGQFGQRPERIVGVGREPLADAPRHPPTKGVARERHHPVAVLRLHQQATLRSKIIILITILSSF